MIGDPYVVQTDQVLLRIYRRMKVTYICRNAEMVDMRAAFVANEVSAEERRAAIARYEAWKVRAEGFRCLLTRDGENIISLDEAVRRGFWKMSRIEKGQISDYTGLTALLASEQSTQRAGARGHRSCEVA
ncbi:hypothetical protein SAMN05216174_106318 [Actinokineospora iranica]|uniref:Uncharacterized protein n=2 Tax=Actinokineospora iranica TaxID=1271860 RepID=A0A1G6RFR3_9PSEU|nr:hypothetical protein SAMN05216174_106318 [Actinokineospora iranica]